MHSHASPLEPAPAACRYLFCPSPQEYLLIGRHLHHDSLLPARGTTSKHAAHEANAVVAPDPELEGGSGLHPIAQLERATPHVVRVEREDHVSRKNSFFFSSRRRHTRSLRDWSSDVCSSDLRSRLEAICARTTARRSACPSWG